MKVYIVTSSEFTTNADESSCMVRGCFLSYDSALKCKTEMVNESLQNFKTEFVEYDGSYNTIIRDNEDSDYRYEISIECKEVKD